MFLKTKNKMKFFYYIIFVWLMFASEFVPENSQVINYTQVFFRWPQIENHDSYQFILSENIAFVDSDTTTSLSNSILYDEFLDWGTTYYWKSCAIEDNSNVCLPSQYFTTNTLPSHHADQINIFHIDEDEYTDGINILDFESLNYSLAIDRHGQTIWFAEKDNFDFSRIVVTQFLDSGNLIGFSNGTGYEFNLDSDIIFQTPSAYNIHHQISKSDAGTYFFIDAEIEYHDCPAECNEEFSEFPIPWQGDRFIEINSDGEEIWEWNTFDYISLTEYNPLYAEMYNEVNEFDWTHSNSIFYDPISESLYVSIRNLSRVTSIDYETGNVNWNLGESDFMENPSFENELNFSQQHSVQLTSLGNLIFFDNARHQNPELSRCIEVGFDDSNEPFLVWEHTLPDSMFTGSRGECDRLSSGNSLISAGRTGNVIEVNSENELIWHLNVNDQHGNDVTIYRTDRILNLFPSAFSFKINQIVGDYFNYSVVNNGFLDIIIYNHGWGINEFKYSLSDHLGMVILDGSIVDSSNIIELSLDLSTYNIDNSNYVFNLSPANNSNNNQEISFYFTDLLLGDLNEDNQINILDVMVALNLIISDSEYLENADLNQDGNLDIFDIILLLNIILTDNN